MTVLWLIGKGTAQEAPKTEAAKPAETSNQPATYVGSQACQACHEDIYNAFQKSPHIVVEGEKKRGWDGKACESCHGPASKHAESARCRPDPESRKTARRRRPIASA